jgi:hypothetical protein
MLFLRLPLLLLLELLTGIRLLLHLAGPPVPGAVFELASTTELAVAFLRIRAPQQSASRASTDDLVRVASAVSGGHDSRPSVLGVARPACAGFQAQYRASAA